MLYPEVTMPAHLQVMFDTLMGRLKQIEESGDPPMSRAARSVEISKQAIEELKAYVIENPFEGKGKEIYFFKYIKPMFYCQFLFHRQVYFLQASKPEGGEKTIRKYYKRKLLGLLDHFNENRMMYEYIRRDSTYRDDMYFLRHSPMDAGVEAILPDADLQFSTAKDFAVAEILKNQHMEKYLMALLRPEEAGDTAIPDSGVHWTATLNAFYQLMRALIKKGAINNGNISMNKFAEACEWFFHIDLKNMYRGMQENRIKKDRSAFLKELVKIHEEDLDELDENPRYK